MLCTSCQSMLKTNTQQLGATHHKRLQDLEDAVRLGCRICATIHEQTIVQQIKDTENRSAFTTYEYDSYARGNLMPSKSSLLRISFGLSENDSREFMLVPLEKSLEDVIISGRPYDSRNAPDHAGHENALSLASHWLQTCLQNHPACALSSSVQTSEYPKRLLEIKEDTVRLLETFISKPDRPYATLSHCWGPKPTFHTLTADNLAQMMDEIPMSLLPPTFQDAIKVSRSVGIGLLWIDSLCILQAGKGSVDDWKEHAISMRKIYANGVLNISADQAFSAEGGFLHSRDPRKIQSITTAYSTLPNSVYQIVDLELTRAYLAESPIAERAWVLQERVLSSRVLHFTSRQLFWECNQLPLACETYPLGIPNFSDQQRLTMAAFNFDRTIGKARVEWYRLLEDYARRKLTYPNKDKLAALAGIVEKLQSGANEQYIAGIFRFDIPFALMWCVKPYTPDLSLPTSSSLRGPSWSWVSQDHPITYEAATLIHDEYNAKGQEIASIAELMELSPLPLQSKTPMVQLCAARLVLRAQTHRVEWDSQTQAQHLDLGLQFRFPDAKSDIECVGTLDNPILNMPCPKEVIAVVLVKATAQFALFKEAGLFLVPDDSLDLRCYRRVGFWWTAFNKGGPDGLPNTKVVTITII